MGFIVHNSEEGLSLLHEWYNVPDNFADMGHLKLHDPQGVQACWDLKVHHKHSEDVVVAPSHLFTTPLGLAVRHNWFKDARFEMELRDILAQRLQHRFGCTQCAAAYEIFNS